MIDTTRAVRPGEELDASKLAAFLSSQVGALSGLNGAELTIEQFPGGHSNLTYLVKARGAEWVLRRPPFGNKVKSAHDMSREVRVTTKLAPLYPPAPRVVAFTEDESILGAPFYVMERIRGVILRKRLPEGVFIDPPLARKLSRAVIDGLADLHAIDYQVAGLGDFGKPDGYVERQVTGWTERYIKSQTDDVPDVLAIAEWLKSRLPTSPAPTVLHNDWKYDNLVLDTNDMSSIIGVLDWEMATIGDPLMDLGTALSYWVDPMDDDMLRAIAFGPTMLPGSLTRPELAARYATRTGRDISNILFYYCFALFKTAVVAQQIYARFKKGLTKDERFAMMIVGVQVLSRVALEAAKRGEM